MLATVRLPARASVILVNASFKTQAVALAIVNINRVASKHIVTVKPGQAYPPPPPKNTLMNLFFKS